MLYFDADVLLTHASCAHLTALPWWRAGGAGGALSLAAQTVLGIETRTCLCVGHGVLLSTFPHIWQVLGIDKFAADIDGGFLLIRPEQAPTHASHCTHRPPQHLAGAPRRVSASAQLRSFSRAPEP